ncbi:hypothetical protein BUE80_DR008283 [Diplocarpon rosae]|nr:hypothetical protein BUE80_DR008283 [Diplocarpon rosae]
MITPTQTPRYSLEELLSLRTSLPVICCLVKKINKHADIACLFKIPDEALRRPEHFSYRSSYLADITNTFAPRLTGRKNVADSSEQSESQSLSDLRLLPQDHQQVRWNLRRREISDRSSQPHSAPTGLAAQQSENFQRFYRAVVSPTHVRVTAGGRIVLNTRSTAPPSLQWNSDKPAIEFNSRQAQPISMESSLPIAYPPIAQGTYLPTDNSEMRPQSTKSSGGMAHGPQAAGAVSQQPIKISPPTQFDQTKPFLYNGQIVYPVPQGFQPPPPSATLPVTMLGNPGFFPPAGYLPAQFPSQFGGAPMIFPNGQQHAMMTMPNAIQSAENSAPALMQMPGVIAPGEFMQSQIQVMRGHLKQVENQMANNKHQIDEAVMEHQRSILLAQINNLESLLRLHHDQEGAVAHHARGAGKTSGSNEEQKPARTGSHGSYQRSDTVGKVAVSGDEKDQTRVGPQSKSKLSIAAAMAPPFQPRSKTWVSHTSQAMQLKPNSMSTSALEHPKPKESQAEVEARLVAKATSNWNAPEIPYGFQKIYSTLPRSQTIHEGFSQGQQNGRLMSFQRSSTFNGQTVPVNTNVPIIPSTSVPYLVGVLPTGLSAQAASATDLVYDRPLTDDEIRARYLYWGKAPRSVQSGLPKFDGKDFYPPSPVKHNATPLVPHFTGVKPVDAQTIADLHFENLFTDREAPGYRSPPPARPAMNGISTSKPVSRPVCTTSKPDEIDFSTLFTEPGAPGYRSPPPMIKQSVATSNKSVDDSPVTPENPTFFGESEDEEEDARTVDSWQGLAGDNCNGASVKSVKSQRSDAQDTESTVEIRLSPRANGSSPKKVHFYDRVDSSKSSDHHTQFLQTMLKNACQVPIVGTPLSGTISSATAQGYLPQYGGSAAASLAPAESGKISTSGVTSSMVGKFQSENRPFNQQRNNRAPDTMNAEGYLRYITNKGITQDDLKILEQGWNPYTTRTGPTGPGEEW